ncbi:MFS transporter, UMF1 family [Virgibacillus subterraneus]|uniref:MFS transporter, UMF1 family n=2 Tax=Virgibacillus TaxID=84406 RepID=A0A1H1EA13_9BACI|nr:MULTISPECIES: MFS transporter [Virgibacillus]SDQ85651.1 MFS transporter, UMF1 family [Virgibacillus salinus]SEQ40587.1 MFS transporter, UMF1 family [Virgibacillus subterraneus]
MKKKTVFSWMLYDFGNSAFATTIMAAVLPVFYYDVAAVGVDQSLADSYWGYSQSIAALIVAVMAPFLGAISDFSAAKKKFLRFFAFMGIVASILLAFVGEGDYIFASLLLIIGTVGFSSANIFYDAFLPEIADEDDIDKISSYGFAFGYIGGGVLLAINILMILKYSWFGMPNAAVASQVSFVTVGIWWFIFSLPLLKNIKEEKKVKTKRDRSYVAIGFSRVTNTFKEIKQYKHLLIFLLAFWMYNDGISTIIKMATIYGRDIGIDSNSLIAALLITQFVGIPCTFFFGWLASKITAKKALYITLYAYLGIVILGYFMSSALHFYLLAFCVGLVQGGAQSLSRSIYGRMVPANKHAEFFGFYGISAKFAAIFGPFLFAIVGQLTGSSRLGIISLVIFFIVGIVLLRFVNIDQGVMEAKRQTNQSEKIDIKPQ